LACNVPLNKIKVIPNGIDTNQFLPVTNQEKQVLRHNLALSDKYIFAYSGKLNQGKGLELLLRVGKEMASRYSRVHFLLIGGGGNQFLTCERELKQFVEKESMQEHVTFTGYVENVSDYLNAADFFVLPSESEALGISLLEALSCGLPSIETRADGINDILDAGVNGRLFDINDANGLLSIMVEFIADPKSTIKLGKEGRKTVIGKFGIKETVRKHQEHFISL